MEVAGLVLGGLPVILYAIDNYHRCLQATTDYWRYESTIRLIRSHVFVQQQQLQITFRSIGLVDPTPFELEEYLRQRYPDKCDAFVDIISHTEKLLTKLMDKLDVDAQGRPKWTTEPPERVVWEWRRVRRGFGRSSRQKLIDELQFWNEALRTCFDKTELPLDNDTPTLALEAIRSKFNAAGCNNIRQQASQIHNAISRAWKCQSHEHQGNLKLSWHTGADGVTNAKRLSLIFPSQGVMSPLWHEIACDVIEPRSTTVLASRTALQGPIHTQPASDSSSTRHPADPNPRPWKRMKGWLQSPSTRREAEAEMIPTSEPLDSGCFVNPLEIELPPEVSCLCSFLRGAKKLGRLGIQGNHTSDGNFVHVRMERLENLNLANAIPLGTVFGQTSGGLALSRKDRFAVAAAATWAVLNLAGSPWIGPEWSGKDGLRLLTEMQALQSFHHYPAISYAFTSTGTGRQEPKPGQSSSAQVEEIKAGIIRNKTLFVLGILLIELCLDIPFEKLRQESHSESLSASLGIGMPLEDYEVANAFMQRVYFEAGDLYGYAVQRCLRCEFPGRDVTKSFEFEQFRSDFFHGVVAPVQVTFNLLQSLHKVSQL